MNRGFVKLWRRIDESAVFQNEGLLKVFLWCMVRANYKDAYVMVRTGRGYSEVLLPAGSFLFGRESAARELRMPPSTVWKRIKKLKKLEILNIESNSHYSIIYIINWHLYQDIQNESNSERNRQGTGKEHREEVKRIKRIKNPSLDFSENEIPEMMNRYPDSGIIDQVFQSIAGTRKSGRIADSIRLKILQSWAKYPTEQVIAGIQTYLSKGYAGQGKGEKYLAGIIRNLPAPQATPTGPTIRRTGSPLLDTYYQEQGYTLT